VNGAGGYESSPALLYILVVFDLTRGRENRMMSIRELKEHTGRTWLNKDRWPFSAIWAGDGKPQMSYKVPDDVLQWWHEG